MGWDRLSELEMPENGWVAFATKKTTEHSMVTETAGGNSMVTVW